MTYATEHLPQTHGLGGAWRRAAAGLARRMKAFGVSLTRRKAVFDLSRLDDRMLSDIGLTRSDLHEASRWSLWGDPSDRLAAIAEERASASNAAGRDLSPAPCPSRR